MERRAEYIICGRAHTATLREYTEWKKRISAIMNDKGNRSNLSFLREITHNIKL
jgi:hypothetical protein